MVAKKGVWVATDSKRRLGPALPMTKSAAWIWRWMSLVKARGMMVALFLGLAFFVAFDRVLMVE